MAKLIQTLENQLLLLENQRILIESQLLQLRRHLGSIYETDEWITVEKFATLTGLRCKTVSNYCSMGKIVRTNKIKGRYLIHIDEISNYCKQEIHNAGN
jgi:hypothetical protein